jgi:hemerythrin
MSVALQPSAPRRINVTISWYPALAVGVREVDEQHKEIFRRVDSLTQALIERRGAEVLEPMFDFLGEYVVDHFGAEESLMRLHRYPQRAEHEAEHRRFVEDYRALRSEYAREGATGFLLVKLNNRVAHWLTGHISRTDKELGRFLQQKIAAQA